MAVVQHLALHQETATYSDAMLARIIDAMQATHNDPEKQKVQQIRDGAAAKTV
jgi:hypothetical protein